MRGIKNTDKPLHGAQPVLARLLGADVHPRLRSRAVKCIVDFMAECTDDEAELVDGYADGEKFVRAARGLV
jgi:hypothetical protein